MYIKMHSPPHPGEILHRGWIEPLGLTISVAAEALGVTRKTLSAVLNGRSGIGPDMALKLSRAFDTTAEIWLNQQMQYDLWIAMQDKEHTQSQQIKAA